jgi:ABC-2 type transport system permease protein
MSTAIDVVERTSEPPRLHVVARLRELRAHREILLNLVRKELKVKYTASVLGAIWSILNPVVFLAVFTFVSIVLGAGIPNYPVYLLSGLLAWNLFSMSVTQGARSVIDNSNLVKKVAFPREILPLSSIGVALVDFVLQEATLVVLMIAFGYDFRLGTLVLLPLAFAALLVFTMALTVWLSAVNVRYRDVQHLLNLGLLVWFWMTPIVYAGYVLQRELVERSGALFNLYLLNPLASIVGGFQRALYGVVHPADATDPVLFDVSVAWLAGVLGIVLAVSLAGLYLAWRAFFRLSGDFAEEL